MLERDAGDLELGRRQGDSEGCDVSERELPRWGELSTDDADEDGSAAIVSSSGGPGTGRVARYSRFDESNCLHSNMGIERAQDPRSNR